MTPEPIIAEICVGADTLLALHAAAPSRYPALFGSAAAAPPLGRFDILFACPGEHLTLHADRSLQLPRGITHRGDFLAALDEWYARERQQSAQQTHALPFTGGWLLFLAYEFAAQIEPSLRLPEGPSAAPIAQAWRMRAAVIFEHASGRAWILAELPETVAEITRDVANLPGAGGGADQPLLEGAIHEDDPQRFLRAVQSALEHIRAGDIYQANLSRAWRARLAAGATPAEIYRRLRRANPGPFSGVAALESRAVVTSSPERLVQVREQWVSTRPIAGTRPRSTDRRQDADLARELRAHPKERAEHIMLIDLERNDLGRICQAGSVEVDEYMTIESYSHVHHIVSNVRGRLRDGIGPGGVLRAVFPGGTITGCPKVRCMQIIGELEGEGRGAYTGSLGYLNRDGSMDMNILIRTVEIQAGQAVVRAGAGIVADSLPGRELEETRAKARGVLRALSESDPHA